MVDRKNTRDIYPPTGNKLTAKSWMTEAPMRMLMNNLHPGVAENPHELVVYGGIGRAARSWQDFDAIVDSLKTLEETKLFWCNLENRWASLKPTKTPRAC